MDKIQEVLAKLGLGTTFKQMTQREYEQYKIDGHNKMVGNLNEQDGYNCDICKNKGYVMRLVEENDSFRSVVAECRCAETRKSIMRMKRSGLEAIIKEYTFEKFVDEEPWQKVIKGAALEFAKKPEGWFFIGGQSGCGKTHLCTAICSEFLRSGKRVLYMLWRDEIIKIKACVNDSDGYQKIIDEYKTVDVLYIDDLFKTGKTAEFAAQKPTAADVNVAFEIINYRYNNPKLITIISSECNEDEILDIDEAVGGRIYERCKTRSFSIQKNRDRNYRIRKTAAL